MTGRDAFHLAGVQMIIGNHIAKLEKFKKDIESEITELVTMKATVTDLCEKVFEEVNKE